MTGGPPATVLAVDGGGTHCRFALDTPGRRFELTLGPANVWIDFAAALAVLHDGLDRIAVQAGLDAASLRQVPAFFGLAGVIDPASADRVRAALDLPRAVVAGDRDAAVAGALGTADAALAGLGTGSYFALQTGGALRLSGGWGAYLSDDASGYWIARAALRAVLDVQDGLLPPSDLTDLLKRRFGNRPGPLLDFARSASQSEMAALAPLVGDAAAAGDPVARAVLSQGAALVQQVLGRMGWTADVPLCLTGGVSHLYLPHLPRSVRDRVFAPKASALDGAIRLARMGQGQPASRGSGSV